MGTNLTPEQLAELQRLFSTPVETGETNAYRPQSVDYNGMGWTQIGDGNNGTLGYNTNESGIREDNTYDYDNYNPDGTFNARLQGKVSDFNPLKAFLMTAAAMAGGAGLYGAFGGGAASGAGFVGEGALSGVPAWDAALSGAGELAGLGGTAGLTGAGGEMVNGSFLGEAPWTPTPGGPLDFGSTSLLDKAGNVVKSSSLTGNPLLDKAIGAGVSLLGGAAGAKGQKASETQTKDIPEWLKPYITGEGGLLSQTQQQLAASRTPERMAQWDQMRNVGMGLLNRPQVGNPTAGWTFRR